MVVHRWWLNLAGAGSVLAALLTVVFGLPALERAVPAQRAVATAHRHEIAAGVTVIPPAGALIAKRSRTGPGEGSVLFLIGPARFVIAVEPFEGDLQAASGKLRTKIQSMRGYQITAGEAPLVTLSGLSGLAGSFTAPGRIGRFAAFIAPGHIIEVTINGSEGGLQQSLMLIDQSIASLSYGGER